LRSLGYRIPESSNPHAGRRLKPFGMFDIMAMRGGAVLFVKATGRNDAAAILKEFTESDEIPPLQRAGARMEVHRWRKLRGEWLCEVSAVGWR
jgi:hypothetical protein